MYPGGGALGPSLLMSLEDEEDGDDLSRPTILSVGMEPAPLSMVRVEISWVAMSALVLAA